MAVGIHVLEQNGVYFNFHEGSIDNKPVEKQFMDSNKIKLPDIVGKKNLLVRGKNNPALTLTPVSIELDKSKNYFCTSKYCIDN